MTRFDIAIWKERDTMTNFLFREATKKFLRVLHSSIDASGTRSLSQSKKQQLSLLQEDNGRNQPKALESKCLGICKEMQACLRRPRGKR